MKNKFEDLKLSEIEVLGYFCEQIGDLMKSMDDFRIFLDKKDKKKFDKTYKNLGYFWDKIQNQIIYLCDADEREARKL